MNFIAAVGAVYVGALYSAPLLLRVGAIIGENWIGRAAAELSAAIAKHAVAEVVTFGMKATLRVTAEAAMGFIGWALILEQIGELGILAVSDSPLQVWLTRCKFRKDKEAYSGPWGTIIHDKDAGKPYSSVGEEAKAFDGALKGST
ncbi:hypothetical protein CNECB9_4090001 [Cupriavidus necator]|uniref:Uncharacterized protein n=1 Tax=Cupriavidus necator TaxID=106590 RepID=A0A1K0IX93_CUPNE|nr:hypothetical protein CNECB9_4090001 [Cupriavidus necator]